MDDNPRDPHLLANKKVKIEPGLEDEEENNDNDRNRRDVDRSLYNYGWIYQMDDDPLQLKVEIGQQSQELVMEDMDFDQHQHEPEAEIDQDQDQNAEPELNPLEVQQVEEDHQLQLALDPLIMENVMSLVMENLPPKDLLNVRHVSQFWNRSSINEMKRLIWPAINFGDCEKNYSRSLVKQVEFEKMFLVANNKELFHSFEFVNLSSLKSFGHFIYKYSNMVDDYFTMKKLNLSIIEKNMKIEDFYFLLECLAFVSTTLVSLKFTEYFSNINYQDLLFPLMFPNLEELLFKETESQMNQNFHYIEQEMKNHCPYLFFSRIVETAPKLKSLNLKINTRESRSFSKYFDSLSPIAHQFEELDLKFNINILNSGFSEILLQLAQLDNGLRLKSFSLTIDHVKHIEDSEVDDQDIRDIMVYFIRFLHSQSATLRELKLSIRFYTFYDPKPYDKRIKCEEICPLDLLPFLPNLTKLYIRNQMETFKYRHGEEKLFNPIDLKDFCPNLKHLEFYDDYASEPPVFVDQDFQSQLISIKIISD